jgi:hypothetical protein
VSSRSMVREKYSDRPLYRQTESSSKHDGTADTPLRVFELAVGRSSQRLRAQERQEDSLGGIGRGSQERALRWLLANVAASFLPPINYLIFQLGR